MGNVNFLGSNFRDFELQARYLTSAMTVSNDFVVTLPVTRTCITHKKKSSSQVLPNS